MIQLELRTYVTHPLLVKPTLFTTRHNLPHAPPLGSTLVFGELTYLVRTLTWFGAEQQWVSAQEVAFTEAADLLEELADLRRLGWRQEGEKIS